jgi:hypothetical protein
MLWPTLGNAKQECNKGGSVGAAVYTHHTLSCATAHPYDDRIPGLTQRKYGPTMRSKLDGRVSFGRTFL